MYTLLTHTYTEVDKAPFNVYHLLASNQNNEVRINTDVYTDVPPSCCRRVFRAPGKHTPPRVLYLNKVGKYTKWFMRAAHMKTLFHNFAFHDKP